MASASIASLLVTRASFCKAEQAHLECRQAHLKACCCLRR